MNKLLSISNIAITFIGIYLGYLHYSTNNYTINFTKLIQKNDNDKNKNEDEIDLSINIEKVDKSTNTKIKEKVDKYTNTEYVYNKYENYTIDIKNLSEIIDNKNNIIKIDNINWILS